MTALDPGRTEFCILSFEGPDRYSMVGGLGTRVAELAPALAAAGYPTRLVFAGDPALPWREEGNGVQYLRWSQWISRHHPGGVYDGEAGKVADWERSLPSFLCTEVVAPAAEAGKVVVVMAEEWQTAGSLLLLELELRRRRLRSSAVLLWNANNLYGFHLIDWGRLSAAATLTTVSRYMKHQMWRYGVNPVVIPNGIPERSLKAPAAGLQRAVRGAMNEGVTCFKVGRFDPDKGWLGAVEALARLKREGLPVTLLARGGKEAYGAEVLRGAARAGLQVADRPSPRRAAELVTLLRQAGEDGDEVLNLTTFLDEPLLRLLYAASDAVLANSAHEPFGLVGLEVMAAGGLAVTGSTGEDYAEPYSNCLALETEDPSELAEGLEELHRRPERALELRRRGRATARRFTWPRVLEQVADRAAFAALRQGVGLAS